MRVDYTRIKPTVAKLVFEAEAAELKKYKQVIVKKFQPTVKVSGFRSGHVPLDMVEKHVPPEQLQSEFVDEVLTQLYSSAVRQYDLHPVAQPQVKVSKFVPFTTLEFEVEVEVIGEITLPDYKKITAKKGSVSVTEKEVQEVLDNLATRSAEKKDVTRAAKEGDQVWIDFEGVDSKGKPIERADGKDYPLMIGSKTFIPGFEENLVGLKKDDTKTFDVTFPKTYGVKTLQGKKVTFTVNVKNVQEVVMPTFDDEFAKKMGPFTSIKQLKNDIKSQLTHEQQQKAQRDYEAELIQAIAAKTKVEIPQSLIDEQVNRMKAEVTQDLSQRGLTWEEYLKQEGKTEEELTKEVIEPSAKERVKAGLVLSEIASKEKLNVTPEELDIRIDQLKKQYTDEKMHTELDKPENRRDIASRILSEKTIALLAKN